MFGRWLLVSDGSLMYRTVILHLFRRFKAAKPQCASALQSGSCIPENECLKRERLDLEMCTCHGALFSDSPLTSLSWKGAPQAVPEALPSLK